MARTLPAWIIDSAFAIGVNIMVTWPPTTSLSAGSGPLWSAGSGRLSAFFSSIFNILFFRVGADVSRVSQTWKTEATGCRACPLIWINDCRGAQWVNASARKGRASSLGDRREAMIRIGLLAVSLGTGLALAATPASINLSPANVTSLSSLLSVDTAEAGVARRGVARRGVGVGGRYGGRYGVGYGGRYAGRYGGRYLGGYGGRYTGYGVAAAGAVAAGAVAAGAVATGASSHPTDAPSFVNEAVPVEPGLSATVTDPATGRQCTISTEGYHWCWRP